MCSSVDLTDCICLGTKGCRADNVALSFQVQLEVFLLKRCHRAVAGQCPALRALPAARWIQSGVGAVASIQQCV